jgi:hypothetical protein
MPEFPNIVRERLKVSRPTADHPDADLLTAFAERALPEPERAVVAEHLARCHDCRDILALALPATVILEPVRVPLPARGGWLRAPVLRWGVVAAGFAVLAVTGLMRYQRGIGTRSSVAEIQRYETLAPEAKTKSAPAGGAQESAKLQPSAPSVVAEPAGTAASTSRVNARSANGITSNTGSANEQAAATGPMNEKPVPSMGRTLDSKFIAALPLHGSASSRAAEGSSLAGPMKRSGRLYGGAAPSPAGGAGTQSQLVAANGPDQAPSRAFLDVTVNKAKAPETTTVEVSAAATQLETSSVAPASPAAPLALSWAISGTGGLLRSFDQGRTWANVDVNASIPDENLPVASQKVMVVPQSEKYQQATQEASQLRAPAATQNQNQSTALSKSKAVSQQRAAASSVAIPFFRAISAAGLEVWAGGSAGVLYHSANGGDQWTRVVPSAAGIVLTGDIVTIAFSDPRHGQITTSTQELWTTADAGQTWQKQ